MKTNKLFLFMIALGIFSFACTKITPTPNPTDEIRESLAVRSSVPNAIPTAEAEEIFPTRTPTALGIVGNVYLRESPNGTRVGVLEKGTSVQGAECFGDWCHVGNGYVWRGCTDNNPNGLGCSEAR